LLLLHQAPNQLAVLGVAMVVAAGIGAERGGARAAATLTDPDPTQSLAATSDKAPGHVSARSMPAMSAD
jgi:hypothetical protein